MGFERRSRSEDTFKNKYLFYPRNPQQHSLLQTKAERRRRVFGGGAFGCSQTESAYNKKTQGKNLASAFGVEDRVRTHDKKSSYSTHYQQVATATKEYISKGLQVRAQLLLFEQRYTKIRK